MVCIEGRSKGAGLIDQLKYYLNFEKSYSTSNFFHGAAK